MNESNRRFLQSIICNIHLCNCVKKHMKKPAVWKRILGFRGRANHLGHLKRLMRALLGTTWLNWAWLGLIGHIKGFKWTPMGSTDSGRLKWTQLDSSGLKWAKRSLRRIFRFFKKIRMSSWKNNLISFIRNAFKSIAWNYIWRWRWSKR